MQENINTIWQFILDFSNNSLVRANVFTIKIIIIIFSILLLIAIIVLRIKSWPWIMEDFRLRFRGTDIPTFPKPRMRRKWESIRTRMHTREESNYKLAIIEADKMLDQILEASGYPGENLGQRLEKITSAQFSNIQDLLQAHGLVSKLSQNMEYEVKFHEAEQAFKAYEKTLDELEAI
ncbi:hypothetical protein CL633_01245 [bacterium]|nr:hypothetical protein [bacterium]|tara:strand:+ start:3821 stop:4354 length:534 start_codon:yes stop_codon:yes gene_type:complete